MTIKDVEAYLEVPRATLRFYEKEGLIEPKRGGNGYRSYSQEDVERLKKIIIFRKLGMGIAEIEDVLDGTKTLSEAVADNIVSLERQMNELKGALFICHKMQKEKEELETFEVDKYWNVIEEEEKKGNRFLDIAKDIAHYEKSIILEYFNIADVNGNLAVSIPKAVMTVVLCTVIYVSVSCIANGAWTWENIRSGMQTLLWVIVLELVVGIPIFLVGRKKPEVLKQRNKWMFFILLGILVCCILLIILFNVFGA